MSKLLADLINRGAELVDDKGADWLDKAEAGARKALPAIVAEASALLPEGVEVTEAQAVEVLDELAKGKAPLLRAGSVGFAWIVASFDDGEELEARRRYLEHQATFAERNAAMDAAGDAAFDEAKERNDAWEAVAAVFKAVGKVGLSVLVAVARKAVGL